MFRDDIEWRYPKLLDLLDIDVAFFILWSSLGSHVTTCTTCYLYILVVRIVQELARLE